MKTVVLIWIALITLPLTFWFGAFILALIYMYPDFAALAGIVVWTFAYAWRNPSA